MANLRIINVYEFQVDHSEGKKPTFRSGRYQFIVVTDTEKRVLSELEIRKRG